MAKNKLMKCGCSNSGAYRVKFENNQRIETPCCGVHDCEEVMESYPDLNGRKAHCVYGQHAITDSDVQLPFFKYRPDAETDDYYCGCFGWD